ncbi:MAG: methylenetetrahydrofolate reductase [Actinomycetota bacterium]
MALFKKDVPEILESDEAKAHREHLTRNYTIELIPMKSLETAREHLPAGASLSVTCSPAKGIEETQRLTEQFQSEGFDPIPHISARMVRDRAHTTELAHWLRDNGVKKVFLVGGDQDPPGGYVDSILFLADLLECDHGLDRIGVTSYPDHHAFITDEQLHDALHAKQTLLAEAGVSGWCSTQMCFDAEVIEAWLRRERAAGMTLPVHLGVSGVVDKTKLMTMGVRIGLGTSLGYLKKNRAAITKMLTSMSYDPNDLLMPLSNVAVELGIEDVHMYTFNQVEATEQWRAESLAELAG